MPHDPRMPPILDRSQAFEVTPVEICAACPDLLPEMPSRWRRMRRIALELDLLVPVHVHVPD